MTASLSLMYRGSAAILTVAIAGACTRSMTTVGPDRGDRVVEARVAAGDVSLFSRAVGGGRPAIVLHGGPDFDISYLLPELDQLADSFRLVYYDQRGRGLSAVGVRSEDVTLQSDLDDIDRVRRHYGFASPVLIGHSWGTVLALEYALRHPDRVSHLVLMNPAPASASDVGVLRASYTAQLGDAMAEQRRIVAGAAYQSGDPAAVSARYRIHFRHGLVDAAHYERLMTRMDSAFRRQGSAGIVKARAVEDRLMLDSWAKPDYDLLPKVAALRVPTLVIVGAQDFIPPEIAARIAKAIPGAQLVTIPRCGHFAYLECGQEVRAAIDRFFAN